MLCLCVGWEQLTGQRLPSLGSCHSWKPTQVSQEQLLGNTPNTFRWIPAPQEMQVSFLSDSTNLSHSFLRIASPGTGPCAQGPRYRGHPKHSAQSTSTFRDGADHVNMLCTSSPKRLMMRVQGGQQEIRRAESHLESLGTTGHRPAGEEEVLGSSKQTQKLSEGRNTLFFCWICA